MWLRSSFLSLCLLYSCFAAESCYQLRSLLDPLHLTVTITEADWLEEICTQGVAVLHLKKLAKFGNKWVAHILTPRTDMIIPLSYEHKAIDDKHLELIMEALALAWGPTYFSVGGQSFKVFKFDAFIKKIVKEKIYLLPAIAVLMVLCVALVCAGTFCARRRKENAERRALQNQRAELLSDWGQPPDSQTPVVWDDSIDQELSKLPSNTSVQLPKSSNPGSDVNDGSKAKDVTSSTRQGTGLSVRESLDMM